MPSKHKVISFLRHPMTRKAVSYGSRRIGSRMMKNRRVRRTRRVARRAYRHARRVHRRGTKAYKYSRDILAAAGLVGVGAATGGVGDMAFLTGPSIAEEFGDILTAMA